MRNKLGGLCLLTAFVLTSLAVPAMAGTTQPVKRASAPTYDATKEVTLSGTVSSVKASAPGKMPGGHLFLASGANVTDVHLGPFALNGVHGLKVSPGEEVKIVGVMTSFHGSQVFLARTVEANGNTTTIRNRRGFPQLMGATQATHTLSLAKAGAR